MADWIRKHPLAVAALLLLLAGAGGLILLVGVRDGFSPPEEVLLWPSGAPGALGSEAADRPGLAVYLPFGWRSSGAGMIVCPGGAYKLLMTSYEGADIAHWLNSFGVAAFVLRYRIAPRYHYPAPLLDVQRAVRLVRANAGRFGIRADRIGVIGFSAGGHLASSALTHFDVGDPQAADPLDRLSSRPDFGILAYPIITAHAPWTHQPSMENLLGQGADQTLLDEMSSDLRVTSETPPTFLMHTAEDTAVPVENSLLFYSALRRARVPGELHIYQEGPHGSGLANGRHGAYWVPSLLSWSIDAERWLRRYWLPRAPVSLSPAIRFNPRAYMFWRNPEAIR
jgi:acetyl esterase/lipase